MVMDAVGEPDSLQIDNKRLPVGIVFRAVIIRVDGFQDPSQLQAVTSILVPKNVSSKQRRLGKIIDEKLLTKWQVGKTRHLVAQHLQVGKALVNH